MKRQGESGYNRHCCMCGKPLNHIDILVWYCPALVNNMLQVWKENSILVCRKMEREIGFGLCCREAGCKTKSKIIIGCAHFLVRTWRICFFAKWTSSTINVPAKPKYLLRFPDSFLLFISSLITSTWHRKQEFISVLAQCYFHYPWFQSILLFI